MAETVLIVDDDRSVRWALEKALESWNYRTLQAETVAEATQKFTAEGPAAVLLDIDLPDGSGLDFLLRVKDEKSDAIVIMVTGNVDLKNTLAALRGGAHDFIGKPINIEELRVTLRNGLETRSLRKTVDVSKRQQALDFGFDQIIGSSAPMKKTIELAKRVAASDVNTILLQGETGTGKDLFARAIHQSSDRSDAPYLAINCAALPGNLIESELFGHEKGAFTDAKSKKEGLLEQAQGGTIYLDEIGEMELGLQAKLLRVLEAKSFRRVGGLKDLPLNVRVIAASNRDLKKESAEERFRQDLYYRLAVIRINIPPLRERGDDILLLTEFYINKVNQKRGSNRLKGISIETEKIFRNYDWTGNVRELRNVIQRASILEDGDTVTTEYLPADLLEKFERFPRSERVVNLPPEGISMEDVGLELAHQAMEKEGGNLTRAARLLHISRDQLRYRLNKARTGGKKAASGS